MKINNRIGQLDTAWLYAAHQKLQASDQHANAKASASDDRRVEQPSDQPLHADDKLLSQIDAELRQYDERKRVAAANDALYKRNAYELENLRLATLLRDRSMHKRAKKKKNYPRIVNDMLQLEKRYTESARVVQRWWKNYLRRCFWKNYAKQIKACVQLQRLARGYLCRRFVTVWHVNRTRRAIRIQAAFRGHLYRRVLPTWHQWEVFNATKCQSVMRMYLAKQHVRARQRQLACVRIQSLWRGFQCRKSSDLLWLSSKVVHLQRLVRGRLVRHAVKAHAMVCHEAASHIQRLYRGMKARMAVGRLLRDRETQNRLDVMAMLENEEEWHRQHRDKFLARLERFQLKQKVAALEDKYRRTREEIADMEAIYLDMQEQRLRVSPRAIEQGWVEEMASKMKLQRARITQAKLHVMFSLGLELRTKEEEYMHLKRVIERIELERQRFEMWRQEEFLVYWERECRCQHERKALERAQKIADTRRHWSIRFVTKEGKPDKRRKGNEWDASVLEAAKAKQVYCVGNADLLAFMESHLRPSQPGHATDDPTHHKVDANLDNFHKTAERVEQMERQVELVTSTLEMKQTEVILDPVLRDVEARMQQIQRHTAFQPSAKPYHESTNKDNLTKASTQPQTGDFNRDLDDDGSMIAQAQKRRSALKSAKIPWHLLDQLTAERKKLETEKAMFRIWRRGPSKPNKTRK